MAGDAKRQNGKTMDNLQIKATERSPEIDFRFDERVFAIKGESYPEDVSSFFGPVTEKLFAWLDQLSDAAVEFNFELIYFNSSSAKVILGIFDCMEDCASRGNKVVVNWCYDEEDDTMEELGEEFGEDLEHAKFNMKKFSAT